MMTTASHWAIFPRLVLQRPWYVLSCLWDDTYKEPLLLFGKSSPGFLSRYLNGPLLYIRCQITVNKMC